MTAEVAFAKSFLASLDSKPVKLQPDYVADPKTLELNGAYTLPRLPHSMRRPSAPASSSAEPSTASPATNPNPGAAPAATVWLRTLRGPPTLDLALPATPLATSVLELKRRVAAELGVAVDKVRLLHSRKPCADARSVGDVRGPEGGGTVEFSVMIMGGAAAAPGKAGDGGGEAVSVTQGESGASILEGQQFWDDLGGFLEQRVRDREVAAQARRVFEEAWKERGGT